MSDAYAQEDWARVDALVTDDVVRRHAASGTPVDVREALRKYRAIGLDEIVFSGVAGRTDLAAILDVAQGV